jgi:hypothetical protein
MKHREHSSLTELEALDLGVEMWAFLRDHPKIAKKYRLPKRLFSRIRNLFYRCPLCDFYFLEKHCSGCPIQGNCIWGRKIFSRWNDAKSERARAKAASTLVEAIIAKREDLIKKKSSAI